MVKGKIAYILTDDIDSYVNKLIEQELGAQIKPDNRAASCRKTDADRQNRPTLSGKTTEKTDE